jgi:hypothetical protein
MVESGTIHALTARTGTWTTQLVAKLNRTLRGWANDFQVARPSHRSYFGINSAGRGTASDAVAGRAQPRIGPLPAPRSGAFDGNRISLADGVIEATTVATIARNGC